MQLLAGVRVLGVSHENLIRGEQQLLTTAHHQGRILLV